MKMRQRLAGRGTRRLAFTLVELMVVLTIIAVIASLTAGAYMKFIGSQKQSNTVLLVQKLSNALKHHWAAVVDQAREDTISGSAYTLANGDQERARVIWIKLRLKQEFPESFAEVLTPSANDLTPKQSYVNALKEAANEGVNLNGFSQEAQASILLYLSLSQKRRGMNFEPDKELSSNEVQNAGGGLKEIVDAWGTPIMFYRWPTGTQEPVNAGQPQAGLADAQDPRGTLANPNWTGSAAAPSSSYLAFVTTCHNLPLPPASGTPWPMSYRLVPEIASAGPDKAFGLTVTMDLDTNDPQAQDHANDNIYSSDKQMGKGG